MLSCQLWPNFRFGGGLFCHYFSIDFWSGKLIIFHKLDIYDNLSSNIYLKSLVYKSIFAYSDKYWTH